MNLRKLGSDGEQWACKYLEQNGYTITETNFRCTIGEIDIIAKKDSLLVFVEVKLRKNTSFGLPREAVTQKKYKTICEVAEIYLAKQNIFDKDIRFDVIEIFDVANKKINHIENAFWAE